MYSMMLKSLKLHFYIVWHTSHEINGHHIQIKFLEINVNKTYCINGKHKRFKQAPRFLN